MASRPAEVERRRQNIVDLLTAAVLVGAVAADLAVQGRWGTQTMQEVSALVLVALVAWRRRHPVVVAVLTGAFLVAAELTSKGMSLDDRSPVLSALSIAAVFLDAYALGARSPWELSLVGMVPLTAGLAVTTSTVNPFVGMVTLGPWLAGILVASRRRAAAQLEVRAAELEEELDLFAAQSVRYERARIARELHDIVAHSLSVMVVQAGAGERLAVGDPERAAGAFDAISEAAAQAEAEIGRLTELLDASPRAPAGAGLRIVQDLVDRIQATGLRATCRFSGDIEDLPEQSAEAAYRVVQEALTNAMKHAPGAAIVVSVRGGADAVHIRVLNEAARSSASGLEGLGGGRGLASMRERILRCGGTFSAGSTIDHGWQVDATLPRRPARALTAAGG